MYRVSGRPRLRRRVFRNGAQHREWLRINYNGGEGGNNGRYQNFRHPLINENDVIQNSVGSLDQRCQHCNALHFPGESVSGHFNSCCHNGLLWLPQPRTNPQLQYLMLNNKHFMDNIRNYNSAMAFASFSASTKDIPGSGPYTFKVQGQIHRYISDLYPPNEQNPSYGQLYIIDSAVANNIRLGRSENQNLNEATLRHLNDILSENPYNLAYIQAGQMLLNERNQDSPQQLDLRFVDTVSMDKRRCNRPTADEIAGVFTSRDGEPPEHRHVVAHGREGGPKLLSVLSPHCDPMLYPLIFPYGEPGWDKEMTHNGARRQPMRQRVTLLQFVSYRIAIRDGVSHLHSSKKLFQQYLVDQYTRVEENRLNYFKVHQSELRTEQYKGLQDFVMNHMQQENLRAGKIVILPSSFEGSPRNMVQRYQDAMSIVRKYGKPDLFITVTCNPKWPEITNALSPTETASDRPDIVSRVFKLKLNEIKNDILKHDVFGKVVAYVYVIEFQKRGLPHCHMLLVLEDGAKFHEPEDINNLVCAEIPDAEEFPKLNEIVLRTMIHGPCGIRNMNSPCMVDGKCSKGYPKELCDETILNNDGYPKYRRRDRGSTSKGVHQVDNRDVVPYNKYLLLKYDAHINVEVCSSIRSIKYLFKYVYKGYDMANLAFVKNVTTNETNYDEIASYANMRYVSAHECVWRLNQNEMHEQSHTILRLAVHDEGLHNVYFKPGEEAMALENAAYKHTTLTAWFELNTQDQEAHQYLYTEIPNHYTFKSNKWVKRQRGGNNVIGRMYAVAPNDVQRFYIRILLLHVKGATCFRDLRYYNGSYYGTYKEAVIARGLLEDDQEWVNSLEEMVNVNMPNQLRNLFAYICCFCEPTSPLNLWLQFKEHMVEDFRFDNVADAENMALLKIESVLKQNGLDCSKLNLPIPIPTIHNNDLQFSSDECSNKGKKMYETLNAEQKTIVDSILSKVTSNDIENNSIFFLESPGGCGKTFVYSCILNIVRGMGLSALAAAWTGIASLLLDGGTTIHRLFGLPVPLTEASVSSIKYTDDRANLLRNSSIIVIDEASMIPVDAVHCIDRLLRDLTSVQRPMGGKIIVFGGDFRQVLPVIPHSGKVQIIESCVQRSNIWPAVQILHLTKNMRAKDSEKEFSEWLLKLGDGKLSSELGDDIIKIPQEFICDNSIVDHVYGNDFTNENIDALATKAIICPLNDDCGKINNQVLNMIPGEERCYLSIDSIISDDESERLNIPLEYLNSITPSGMPPHNLKLKIGAIVMLIRNMNLASGLVNGVRLIVKAMFEKTLHLEIITGNNKGQAVFLPRIKLITTDKNMPFSFTRTQFPVRLTFAMTINKAQGQTFEKIGIYLGNPVFSHGQLYVAFSRARAAQDIKVKIENRSTQGKINNDGNSYTKNIVFKEILL